MKNYSYFAKISKNPVGIDKNGLKSIVFSSTWNFPLHCCIFKLNYSTTNFLEFLNENVAWISMLPVIIPDKLSRVVLPMCLFQRVFFFVLNTTVPGRWITSIIIINTLKIKTEFKKWRYTYIRTSITWIFMLFFHNIYHLRYQTIYYLVLTLG